MNTVFKVFWYDSTKGMRSHHYTIAPVTAITSAYLIDKLTCSQKYNILMLLLVTRTLPRDGGKTMEPQKPGNSPGSGPEVVEGPRVAKERAAQRVRSWTVQNEMRDVLGRVSTGAAGRILNSANSREVRT